MEEIAGVLFLLWLLLRGKGSPVPGPLFTGELNLPEEPPPDEPTEPTVNDVWPPLVADEPTVERAYRIKQGENLYGDDGIIARALDKALGRPATIAERVAYYKAIGRVRSNWRLYGTVALQDANATTKFTVRNADGSTAIGTITAASCPWHDSWQAAAQQDDLPRRLIGWTRNANASGCNTLKAADNWQAIQHGQSRVLGVLWLPPLAAMDAGEDVTYTAAFDWPAELYAAAGTTWEVWSP